MSQYIQPVAYGLTQALLPEPPKPIIALRIPTTSDFGYSLGTVWVAKNVPSAYILVSISSNIALWQLVAPAGGGSFTTLTSTGQFNLDTTAVGANTLGNTTGATSISSLVGTGGYSVDGVATSNYTFGASTTTGTFNFGGTGANTGTATLFGGTGAQTVNLAASGTGAKTISIGATGSVDVISIGSTTGASSLALKSGSAGVTIAGATVVTGALSSTTTVTAGTALVATTSVTAGTTVTATLGNITATNGDVVLSTATNKITLPGPVNIMSGAGAPANGLAVNVGDMYINTTAASAVTRLYIATAASTWTNVTCAA